MSAEANSVKDTASKNTKELLLCSPSGRNDESIDIQFSPKKGKREVSSMDVSIISSAILFAHSRQKLGQRSLGALGTVSFAKVHLGKKNKNQQEKINKATITKNH